MYRLKWIVRKKNKKQAPNVYVITRYRVARKAIKKTKDITSDDVIELNCLVIIINNNYYNNNNT